MNIQGLITIENSQNPREAMDRLVSAITTKGLTVFARVDHAAGAAEVGMRLRPTELVIFGNAKGGTPLMQCEQTIGIDLPLKMLIWEDADGRNWISYNDPSWIVERHNVAPELLPNLKGMSEMLAALAHAASTGG